MVLKYHEIPSAVTSTYEDLAKNYDCQDVLLKSECLNHPLGKGGFFWIDSKDSDRRWVVYPNIQLIWLSIRFMIQANFEETGADQGNH